MTDELLPEITVGASDELVAALAVAATEPHQAATQVLQRVVPDGWQVDTTDLERYLAVPERTRGTIQAHTAGSLVDAAARHWDDESQLYADLPGRTLTAVLNDDHPECAGWRDHRVMLQLQHAPQFARWAEIDRQWLTREQMVEHLDRFRRDVARPDAATLLEVAQDLRAVRNVQWRDGRRLDNGSVALEYTEVVEGAAGPRGELEIPAEITVAVPIFAGEEATSLVADFRYRPDGASLKLQVAFVDLDDIVRERVEQTAAEVADQLGTTAIYATAPAAVSSSRPA